MKKILIIIAIIALIVVAATIVINNNPIENTQTHTNSEATLIIKVGQTNGGLIDPSNANTWLSTYYSVYSDRTVVFEEKYGGENNTTQTNYKIDQKNYDNLLKLLKTKEKYISSEFAADYSFPTLSTYNEDGSVEKIRQASIEELMEVKGITKELADKLKNI